MARYVKRPVEIEAWKAEDLISTYISDIDRLPIEVAEAIADGVLSFQIAGRFIGIETLEGTMTASESDMVIRGVKGEFYPCKADIFAATYDEANPGDAVVVITNAPPRVNAVQAIKAIRHYTKCTLLYAKGIYDAGGGEIEALPVADARDLVAELESLGWSAHLEFRP